MVQPFLEEEPCARNVLLTIIESVRIGSAAYSGPPSFWWVSTDTGAVVGAASWTPPYALLVSDMPLEAAPGIAEAMIQRAAGVGIWPPGINGPEVAAGAVAAAWTRATGDVIERERTILLNELSALVDVPVPPGSPRLAAADDVPMLGAWLQAFGTEIDVIVGADPVATAMRTVRAGSSISGSTAVLRVHRRVIALPLACCASAPSTHRPSIATAGTDAGSPTR